MTGVRKRLIAIATLAALVLLAGLGGLLLPATSVVSVTARVDAHPATVFALISNSRQASRWLPWLAADPDARATTSGAPRGAGATVTWSSRLAGDGRHALTETEAHTLLRGTLALEGRREGRQEYRLAAANGATMLTWRVEFDLGDAFFARYAALVSKPRLGARLREGLDELEALAVGLPAADFGDLPIEHRRVEARTIAWLPAESEPRADAVSAAMGGAFFRILQFIDRHGLSESGPPMSVSRAYTGGRLRFDAAIPVRGVTPETPRTERGVRLGESYEGQVVTARHVGPYRTLGATHDKVAAYLAASGIERNGDAWETYVSDPSRTAEENLETRVNYPVKAAD